jgi:mono/diheme cytochrome c family protein
LIGNLISLIILGLVVLLFGWLTWRAWHARSGIVKWGGSILAGLVTLLLLIIAFVTAKGFLTFYLPAGSPPQVLQVEGTPEQIARGRHIATMFCAGCHGENEKLPLKGGNDLAAGTPFPLGSMIAVNLTPAGPLKDWSDGEILRVLREGVDRDGNRLAVMSTQQSRHMSDEDLHAVIAFLRSQEPVENATPQPPDNLNLLAMFMLGANIIPVQPPVTGVVTAPPKAPTAEYGKYIVSFSDCEICHGPKLDGVGGSPLIPQQAPNLRAVQGWTVDQFIQTLRTGMDPSGHQLSDVMPWRTIGQMDDDELGALYAYLKSLPPAP